MTDKRMLIIGGTGATGSWFARYFVEKGFLVSVWGPSGRKEKAAEIGVEWADDLMEAVEESQVVVISVPIDRTVEVIESVAGHMLPGSLLMDLTSLKAGPMEAMIRSAPPGVDLLGTHPMFGPTMPSLRGQTIILTPALDRLGEWPDVMRSFFEADGAKIEVMTPAEHDRVMAVVQALTHFAYIGIGASLEALDFDVERSRRFMSPVYEIMLDFVGRILDQSPDLYASIQGNPLAHEVRETFIAQCRRLSDRIDAGDLEGFQDIMREAALHFGHTHQALERSDAIINRKVRRD